MFVLHPLLVPDRVEARDYQLRLAAVAAEHPTLLVLPTGLGKTLIALLASLRFLESKAAGKILVLAPTKPLVEQHARVFSSLLAGIPVAAFTGETGPAERDEGWTSARVVVATPQVVQNDVLRGVRDLRDVALVVFDEAHRAAGNYPYVFLARRYREAGGEAVLGMTASPGSDVARVQLVMGNLGLQRIEVRTDRDPDVAPYIHEVQTQWVRVKPTPAMIRAIALLTRCYVRASASLRRLGYLDGVRGTPSRRELLDVARRVRTELGQRHAPKGAYEATSIQARALKIQHALELAETQGLGVLQNFLLRVQAEAERVGGSRAARDFVADPEFAETLAVCREHPEPHPKVGRALELVAQGLAGGARRILLFANFRETAELLVSQLGGVAACRVQRFVGHATASGERGLTKKAQQDVVERFRAGDVNVLVATSVAEEGLDLPETDLVILFEPVPSAIRMIQRRGRTGRRGEGSVLVLVTDGTRDEQYHWSALRREKRMHEELAFLRSRAASVGSFGPTRPDPGPSRGPVAVELIVDQRETAGPVPRMLLDRGARLKTLTLDVGDYVTGAGLRVERKSVNDLVTSLKDGRLFQQAARLQEEGGGVLLVEGDLAPAASRVGLAPLLGALAALVADYGVSTVQVPDAAATADFLWSLARREGRVEDGARLRREKGPAQGPELARFLVEGLPGVGPVLARRLLSAFGSVRGVFTAEPDALARVEGVGPERARAIAAVVSASAALEGPGGGVVSQERADRAAGREAAEPQRLQPRAVEAAPQVSLVASGHAYHGVGPIVPG